jgi:Zn-dependent peptidase ImmA (M78 family)/transcriptional regulator with XRE-family HTH domain
VSERREPVVPVGHQDLHLATHFFNPDRLVLARELRGLTKVELSQKVGKTASALSQFESGRLRPDASSVGRLALSLGVQPGFFARQGGSVISPDVCHFRRLRGVAVREQRRLLAQGTLLCEVLAELHDVVEWPEEQVHKVACSASTLDDLEACAVSVRQGWGLGVGPLPNVVQLLESKGAFVTRVPDACREVDAFSAWHRGRPLVFLVTEKESTSRSRFDAAHELGHLVLHPDVSPGDPECEREAHRFAGAFLVPREPFLAECPRRLDWEYLYELKRRWGMSVAAFIRRAFDLRVFSEATYKRAFMALNQRGERLQEPHEPPQETPSLLRKALNLLGSDGVTMLASRLGLTEEDVQVLAGAEKTA